MGLAQGLTDGSAILQNKEALAIGVAIPCRKALSVAGSDIANAVAKNTSLIGPDSLLLRWKTETDPLYQSNDPIHIHAMRKTRQVGL